jgi:hypothetical protein
MLTYSFDKLHRISFAIVFGSAGIPVRATSVVSAFPDAFIRELPHKNLSTQIGRQTLNCASVEGPVRPLTILNLAQSRERFSL